MIAYFKYEWTLDTDECLSKITVIIIRGEQLTTFWKFEVYNVIHVLESRLGSSTLQMVNEGEYAHAMP